MVPLKRFFALYFIYRVFKPPLHVCYCNDIIYPHIASTNPFTACTNSLINANNFRKIAALHLWCL